MNLNRSSEVWNKQAHQGLKLEHRSGFSVDSISKDFRDSRVKAHPMLAYISPERPLTSQAAPSIDLARPSPPPDVLDYVLPYDVACFSSVSWN